MKTPEKTPTTNRCLSDLDPLLKRLNLKSLKPDLERILSEPATASATPVDIIFEVLSNEVDRRDTNALNRRLKEANLRYPQASVSQLDLKFDRGLSKSKIQALLSCDWIRFHQNCVIVGASGLGKTWLANMLAVTAVAQGFKAKVVRLPRLLQEVYAARQVPTEYRKTLSSYKKIDLLVLDDWGIGQLDANSRSDLLEIIEERHGTGSTIITSMLPVKSWAAYINDATYSDAILDRLIQNAHRFELRGESLRAEPQYGAVINS